MNPILINGIILPFDSILNSVMMFYILHNSEAESEVRFCLQESSEGETTEEMAWVEFSGCRPLKIRKSVMIAEGLQRFRLENSEVMDRIRHYNNTMCRRYDEPIPIGELEIATQEQMDYRMHQLFLE